MSYNLFTVNTTTTYVNRNAWKFLKTRYLLTLPLQLLHLSKNMSNYCKQTNNLEKLKKYFLSRLSCFIQINLGDTGFLGSVHGANLKVRLVAFVAQRNNTRAATFLWFQMLLPNVQENFILVCNAKLFKEGITLCDIQY